ncbi:MFS transporter [Bradyrhizobium sp. CCBAU 53415]|uniref:MFS transporter n=1 Tax=Bradyrhizobium sp. CCBAU 53415 TaxID=1325119 RepID=UPI00230659E3|nr:MFS transporter [Bradyrhizobium sp. CCBAU 53415]MDA9464677.1 MFS transporter [Bradyrhizobium sp. CCBAU 53415]
MPSIETPYSWIRLFVSIILSTLGCVGMWSLVVALPAVQADFDAPRAEATLPYTLAIIGFMIGGIIVGRLADRFGILPPLAGGTILMSLGYILSASAPNLFVFAIICGVTIGLGGAASFAPLVADTSLWFDRHRGLAVSLATAGSSLAGVVWPPIVQHAIAAHGWRQTHVGIGLLCLATMLPLSLALLRRPILQKATPAAASPGDTMRAIGLSPGATQGLLALAGMCCCVAMSMPQVHLVVYCGDLGYGAARGAEMLAIMLGFGVASRLIFGWVLNLIGGLPTLLLGSAMQAIALALYLPFNGLVSLYVVSAVFGLAQGGIVPSYAVIIRELFPAQEAGFRVSLAISVTLAGMALGSWMAGAIYDRTGSYAPALINGIAWNIANMTIAAWLLRRQRQRTVRVCAASAALS